MIVRRLPDSELYHHGIMGMKWGVRRYQNKDGSLTNAGRKHRGLIEQISYNRKMKKVRKARVEKMKAQQREKEEKVKKLQQANAERRERAEVIKTGSAKDIQKFQHKMSTKEYEEALTRINFKQQLDSAMAAQSKAKADKMAARLNTLMNTANTVSSIAQSASNVYSSLEKMGIIKKTDTKSGIDKQIAKYTKEAELTKKKSDIALNNLNLAKNESTLSKLKKGENVDTNTTVTSTDIENLKKWMKEELSSR